MLGDNEYLNAWPARYRRPFMWPWSWKKTAAIGGILIVAVLAAVAVWQGSRALIAWNAVNRVELDTQDVRDELQNLPGTDTPDSPPLVVGGREYLTVLAIGSDERPLDEPDRQEGVYADAVLLYLAPVDGSNPVLVSLPRDLLLHDPCTGQEAKLDRLLAGCGESITGPELVAVAVEDFTQIKVDHIVLFGFGEFIFLIDAVGGVELCVPHALREGGVDLLPAGCSTADGETALSWIRSRTTQEFVDGEWRFV